METVRQIKNKGGRPRKEIRRDQQLAVMCSMTERKLIEAKARLANVSISEFLRSLAIDGQIGRRIKVLPKEILLFTATLNHLAANMNQVAKKRNQHDELNDIERAVLQVLSIDIKNMAEAIKNYLR